MRAAAINRFGPPSVLSIRDLPVPTPSPAEVVIALEWAGVGSWDASIRDGSWAEGRTKFPLVPGMDGAGVVVARGARVRRLAIGDRVYAYEFGNSKGGFYAQYAAVHANHADRVPRELDTRDAAAMVTTALTAMQGVDRLRSPKRIESSHIRSVRRRGDDGSSDRQASRSNRHRDCVRPSRDTHRSRARGRLRHRRAPSFRA